MVVPEQETPLILLVFLGALGSSLILFYRNFLRPKEPTVLLQKVYVFSSLLSSFLGVVSILNKNKTLLLYNWILSGLLMLYSVVALFLPSPYKISIMTWSDFFLVGLFVSFLVLRVYASLLLIYDRARRITDPKVSVRSIPKPEDLNTINIPDKKLPGIV